MNVFHTGDEIALVACSNGIRLSGKAKMEELCTVLEEMGLKVWISPCLYEQDGWSAKPKERAEVLMDCFRKQKIRGIFDVSGGDLAIEILPYLDFGVLAKHPKPFFGYSDLTVLLNAIYQKTGEPCCLYQIRNLIREEKSWQRSAFTETFFGGGRSLYESSFYFLQGERMQGTVVGGNIRCLLKLAGTEFFPDLKGKLLFLEARNGEWPLISSLLYQIKIMKLFDSINGLLLGTFSKLEETQGREAIFPILARLALPKELPVAKTYEIGHGADSRALVIGETLMLDNAMKRVYS